MHWRAASLSSLLINNSARIYKMKRHWCSVSPHGEIWRSLSAGRMTSNCWNYTDQWQLEEEIRLKLKFEVWNLYDCFYRSVYSQHYNNSSLLIIRKLSESDHLESHWAVCLHLLVLLVKMFGQRGKTSINFIYWMTRENGAVLELNLCRDDHNIDLNLIFKP